MTADERGEEYWLSVIARSLASFSLQTAEMRPKSLTEKARYLLGVGLSPKDASEMLGTTEASLRELVRIAKKGGRRKTRAR